MQTVLRVEFPAACGGIIHFDSLNDNSAKNTPAIPGSRFQQIDPQVISIAVAAETPPITGQLLTAISPTLFAVFVYQILS